MCLGGIDAIYLADRMSQAGGADVVVAGGMESMTAAPYLLPKARAGYRMGNGELIDSLGLKGQRVGDVTVSDKHANFFVAGPEATSEDVRGLVDKIKERVLRLSGTILEPEIQFVGFRK